MLAGVMVVAKLALGAAAALCLYRLLRGPSLPDRILALDTLAVQAAAFFVILGVELGTMLYVELALTVALLSFLGTVAAAKYLMRGDLID